MTLFKMRGLCYTVICIVKLVSIKRDGTMVTNNIELDVKVKCIELDTTQTQIADNIGTTKSYISRLIKKSDSVVNKTFVRLMEDLGYDIELTYVKRDVQ